MIDHLDIFICPACSADLKVHDDGVKCVECHQRYEVEDDIPLLFCPHDRHGSKGDVTEIVRAFYEETPFPNYEDFETIGDLVQKSERGIFGRMLNEQIPFNIRVLEVGCGTGQLSNFLGIAHRAVFGTDVCLNSLKLAQEFKNRNGLERVGFYQMNLFRPIFREESFPLVMCNGVLHSTSDPFGGFQSIAGLVKKGGYILIGLYDTYGRLITDLRRVVFNITGDRFRFLDPRLRGDDRGDAKKQAWFMDQYKHPHESKHTLKEVQGWFDRSGFEFVNSVPLVKAFRDFSQDERLFKENPRGNLLDHVFLEAKLFLTGSKEGGLFMAIGRKL